MTTSAIIFMGFAWGIIISMFSFCMFKTLTADGKNGSGREKKYPPDEPTLPDDNKNHTH